MFREYLANDPYTRARVAGTIGYAWALLDAPEEAEACVIALSQGLTYERATNMLVDMLINAGFGSAVAGVTPEALQRWYVAQAGAHPAMYVDGRS